MLPAIDREEMSSNVISVSIEVPKLFLAPPVADVVYKYLFLSLVYSLYKLFLLSVPGASRQDFLDLCKMSIKSLDSCFSYHIKHK